MQTMQEYTSTKHTFDRFHRLIPREAEAFIKQIDKPGAVFYPGRIESDGSYKIKRYKDISFLEASNWYEGITHYITIYPDKKEVIYEGKSGVNKYILVGENTDYNRLIDIIVKNFEKHQFHRIFDARSDSYAELDDEISMNWLSYIN